MNLDCLMPLIREYPDQELVSFIKLGVRYKADLEPVILLQPHLMSFLAVQDKFLKEADRFIQRGWTEVHPYLPCVPFRSTLVVQWLRQEGSNCTCAAMYRLQRTQRRYREGNLGSRPERTTPTEALRERPMDVGMR